MSKNTFEEIKVENSSQTTEDIKSQIQEPHNCKQDKCLKQSTTIQSEILKRHCNQR